MGAAASKRRLTDKERALARILEECLEAMRQGETDLDALANRYPHARQEVRELLEIAKTLFKRQPRPEAPALGLLLRARKGRPLQPRRS